MTPTRSMIASEINPQSGEAPKYIFCRLTHDDAGGMVRCTERTFAALEKTGRWLVVVHGGHENHYRYTGGPAWILDQDLYEDAPCDSTGAPMVYLPCLFCAAPSSVMHRPGCPGVDAKLTAPAPEGWVR